MPTHDEEDRFWRDWALLTRDQRIAFRKATKRLNRDLVTGEGIRAGLRVKGVQGHPGIFEMTWAGAWAGDGRATFHYGKPRRPGELHITWRRIGTHDILKIP